MKTSEVLTCLGKGLLVGGGVALAFNGAEDFIIDTIRYVNPEEFGCSARSDFITSATTLLVTTIVVGGAAALKFFFTKQNPDRSEEDPLFELGQRRSYNSL